MFIRPFPRYVRPVSRAARPRLEPLEDRKLLYAFSGGEWVYGSRITYSFAPDGTDVGGISSNLNQAMAVRGIGAQTWRDQFRRAAAIWQSVANINLVEVSDNGMPLATAGNQQSDSGFGDIRIAGVPLSSGTVGVAFLPPPINGGTLAGDIVLNSSSYWQVNANYDIMTVALHEFGHALGLGHSTVTAAAMFSSYTAMKQSATTDDINGIRSLYQARQNDAFDASASNGSYLTATSLNGLLDSDGQARIPALDISTSSDNDWFAVTAPSTTSGALTVTVQSTGLSSLSPRLAVHSSSLTTIGQASSTAYGATVSVTVNNVTPGQLIYLRVQATPGGASLTGNYGLLVNFSPLPIASIDPPETTVAQHADHGTSGALMGGGGRGYHPPEPVAVGTLTAYGDAFSLTTIPHDRNHYGDDHHETSAPPPTLPERSNTHTAAVDTVTTPDIDYASLYATTSPLSVGFRVRKLILSLTDGGN